MRAENILDIFDIFFDTRYPRVEKYVEKVSKFVLCRKIPRKSLDNTRESELPG